MTRSAAPPARTTSFAEAVCLVLIDQGVDHGWAVGSLLAPDGEIGRIWTLSRPLTYRAIDGLVEQRLVTRKGVAAGRGRDRVVVGATAAGRRAAAAWLDRPVEHVRDVRIELLVKLHLRDRAGLDRGPLLDRQTEALAPALAALIAMRPGGDLVALWRRESALAVRRFLHRARATRPRHHAMSDERA